MVHSVQVRCEDCGLVFSNPRATPEELDAYYRDYFSAESPEHFSAEWQETKRRSALSHLEEIGRFAQGKRLLEIGTGTGTFLSTAHDAGYAVAGLELSQEAIDHAAERFGLREIRRATVEQAGLPEKSFDVIYAWHVIEHVDDLDCFLAEIKRLLAPGGIVYLGTESYGHLIATALRVWRLIRGRVPPFVTNSAHTYVFTPDVLKACLERRDFHVLEVHAYDELSVEERRALFPPGPKGAVLRAAATIAPRDRPSVWGRSLHQDHREANLVRRAQPQVVDVPSARDLESVPVVETQSIDIALLRRNRHHLRLRKGPIHGSVHEQRSDSHSGFRGADQHDLGDIAAFNCHEPNRFGNCGRHSE
jgi:2-polyprenyl-3-methyl-5-hydroxy-6-metoxy-1,4-benzoquinol methylase